MDRTVTAEPGFQFFAASSVRYLRAVSSIGSSLVIASRKPSTISAGLALSAGGTPNTRTWESTPWEACTCRISPLSGIEAQPASSSPVSAVAPSAPHRPAGGLRRPGARELLGSASTCSILC